MSVRKNLRNIRKSLYADDALLADFDNYIHLAIAQPVYADDAKIEVSVLKNLPRKSLTSSYAPGVPVPPHRPGLRRACTWLATPSPAELDGDSSMW